MELAVAQRWSRVAAETAALGESRHPAFLLLGHRAVVTDEPKVEGRVGRIERPLEGGQGERDGVGVDRVVVAGEGGVEPLDIDVELGDPLQRLLERHRHLDFGLDWSEGLLLEHRRPAAPELGAEKAGIEDGRGIALADLAVLTDARGMRSV